MSRSKNKWASERARVHARAMEMLNRRGSPFSRMEIDRCKDAVMVYLLVPGNRERTNRRRVNQYNNSADNVDRK